MPEKLIGRFEVVRELGRGAQGVVYLARDPRLDRQVAIKTLRVVSSAQSDGLLREAKTVSNLQHPNIIPLYDLGSDEGAPYLVYAYIEGETLAHLLKRSGALSMAASARIVADVLDALSSAHGQGIMHLDIKPANVMISSSGQHFTAARCSRRHNRNATIHGAGNDFFTGCRVSFRYFFSGRDAV
jgi:serine/threonine protein kinase